MHAISQGCIVFLVSLREKDVAFAREFVENAACSDPCALLFSALLR
jgi:hypothetical protein